MGGARPPRSSDFRAARIGAAAALVSVVAFIVVFDALSPEYAVNEVVITVLLGTLGTLLGIEGFASLRQGPTPPPPPPGKDYRSPYAGELAEHDPPED